jgi:hypothetical protein
MTTGHQYTTHHLTEWCAYAGLASSPPCTDEDRPWPHPWCGSCRACKLTIVSYKATWRNTQSVIYYMPTPFLPPNYVHAGCAHRLLHTGETPAFGVPFLGIVSRCFETARRAGLSNISPSHRIYALRLRGLAGCLSVCPLDRHSTGVGTLHGGHGGTGSRLPSSFVHGRSMVVTKTKLTLRPAAVLGWSAATRVVAIPVDIVWV